MEVIGNVIPCRQEQLDQLFKIFGESDEPLPHSLFISGSMGTGKTLCVDAVLDYLGIVKVKIDCVEDYSPHCIYETILSELEEDTIKCDTMLEFINELSRVRSKQTHYEPIVLVLDKAERLRTMDHSIMSAFLRLRELCHLNICTVFITHLLYENFFFKMGKREPLMLYFPNYNKEELFQIIISNRNSFIQRVLHSHDVTDIVEQELKTSELFANFLNAFLSVFYRPCRDLIELKHMAAVNFVKYCAPIINGEIEAGDLPKLWRHISPILKTSLEMLYLRTNTPGMLSTSLEKENLNPVSTPVYSVEKTLREELTSNKMFAQSFELPYYAKHLLIAAYLASYNPPKEDKRLFMKNHGKKRKNVQQMRNKAKINEKLNTQLGPKIFTLGRLLAIFYALLEENVGLTSNLLSQLATLVELKLIAGSKEIDLQMAKYKCLVGFDFVTAVAETVGFNVKKYLFDFI